MAGVISSLVNTRDLELECARVLYEILLVSVLMCGIGTMLHKEKAESYDLFESRRETDA